MAKQLEARVALVTGAGRGIGYGIASVLASRGASVAICDISGQSADSAAQAVVQAGGSAIAIAADVTDPDSMRRAVATATSAFGKVDIAVANAGVIGAPGYEERLEYSEADWDQTYGVNVIGIANTADAVIPGMKILGGGRIITIASHSGRAPRGLKSRPGTVGMPYGASKAAAIQLTHALAIELAPFNITVNCVCPGTLWTPMWEKIATNVTRHEASYAGVSPREVFDRAIKSHTPLNRGQTPEDIGKTVAFFASDDASEITGQALNVNGGAILS